MMNFNPYRSTVNHALAETTKEILTKFARANENYSSIEPFNPSFSLDRSLFAVELSNALVDESNHWYTTHGHSTESYVLDKIRQNTLQFGPMSLKEGLSLVKDEILSDDFYGILAVNYDTKGRINPLHPLIASELASNWDSYKDELYTFYVFSGTWKNSTQESIDSDMDHIANILAAYSNKQDIIESEATTVIMNEREIQISLDNIESIVDEFMNNRDVAINSDSTLLTESRNTPYFLVPIQIISDGLAYPSYGTSMLSRSATNTVWGTDCSPMGSANIGTLIVRNSSSDGLHMTSVCTGGNGSDTYGMATMNHSNLQSPMNSSCICDGWESYAEASIIVSYEILDSLLTYTPPVVLTRTDFNTTAEWLDHLASKHIQGD